LTDSQANLNELFVPGKDAVQMRLRFKRCFGSITAGCQARMRRKSAAKVLQA
jgi:hypothetical protein